MNRFMPGFLRRLSTLPSGAHASGTASALLSGALLLTLSCAPSGQSHSSPSETPKEAKFVGAEFCVPCHAEEAKLWRGSHHAMAMEKAEDKTVLGDFNGVTFQHFGVTSTFTHKDGKFTVRTDGPDGKLQDYPIEDTFGVDPLQQYLIPFPDGRLQALSIAWDSRPASQGGQRWFHLYPDEKMPAGDILHWTGPYQNWNFMCAECHSTDVKKEYQAAENRYATTWSDINVACEACHGPGSEHLAWAGKERDRARGLPEGSMGLMVRLKDADSASWLMERQTGIAKRSRPRLSRVEVETCARCHARRATLSEDYVYGRPLMNTHRISLLDEDLYYPDGQVKGEVYEYGSFLQSKMYAAGVTCHDCHDPHSAGLTASGNAVCARCHLPGKFDSPAHHHHSASGPGSRCVDCHMPTTNFMVVDARHDHSIRIPRPDLTLKIGTPNACSKCHAESPPQWAADWAVKWWGSEKSSQPHYGEAIQAGRAGLPGAAQALSELLSDSTKPGIVRATAASLVGSNPAPDSLSTLQVALKDSDPLIRLGALTALEEVAPAPRVSLAAPLLTDPILAVRIQASRLLAAVPADSLTQEQRSALASALAEFRSTQEFNADRPESQLNLGTLAAELGQVAQAEQAYRTAIKLAPGFAPAYANLADLYRSTNREMEGEAVLREGIKEAPAAPALHYSLGLLLIREKRTPEALKQLSEAVKLAPDDARFTYVYAVALESVGRMDQALSTLESAHKAHPGNRDILAALATYNEKKGNLEAATQYAQQLVAISPDDPGAIQLLMQINKSRVPRTP